MVNAPYISYFYKNVIRVRYDMNQLTNGWHQHVIKYFIFFINL